MQNKFHTIKLYQDELLILVNILDNFSDYVAGDDRIDHGWNRLKEWRQGSSETKQMLYKLNGRLARLLRRTALRGKTK
jgi:hypothetical protein